jgi:hypothetical protein
MERTSVRPAQANLIDGHRDQTIAEHTPLTNDAAGHREKAVTRRSF